MGRPDRRWWATPSGRPETGLLSRASDQLRAKLSTLVSRVSDPSAELDYSYERMRDELQDVNRGVADLATQRKRLAKHRDRLQVNADKATEQAHEAFEHDREALATRALEKRRANLERITSLTDHLEELRATQERLLERRDELESRIRRFRTERETVNARYEATEASARISEALSGIGDEMGEVGRSIERATERTEAMEARAAALDSVLEEGDDIDRELDRLPREKQLDADLATLRAELEREAALGPGDGDETAAREAT